MELIEGQTGTWKGKIKNIMFVGQNDFAIVSLVLNDGTTVTASGTFVCPERDAEVTVKGQVALNTKYNELQINVKSSDVKVSPERVIALKFLSSGAVNGIGDKTATQLVDKYGTDLSKYMSNPAKLSQIKGISERKAKKIVESYKEQRDLLPIYAVVNGKITLNQANKIKDEYGNKSAEVLKKNPYILTYSIAGFGFNTVDNLALRMGYNPQGKDRFNAAICHALNTAETESGHLYLPLTEAITEAQFLVHGISELKTIFYRKVLSVSAIPDNTEEWDGCVLASYIKDHSRKLNTIIKNWCKDKENIAKKEKLTLEEVECLNFYVEESSTIEGSMKEAILEKSSIADADGTLDTNDEDIFVILTTKNGSKKLYKKTTYLAEKEVANLVVGLLKEKPLKVITAEKIKETIKNTEKAAGIALDEDQKAAVLMTLQNRISIITGGPGRGKTTIIKMVIDAWNDNYNVVLLAPTGKAAKRMSEATGCEAQTIHRFLFTKKEGILNDKTIVIVDETSMMDIYLAKRLLINTKKAQICFVGDVDQLPSVGAGAFLEDLINSKVVPFTKLESCHRNAGSILFNSTVINAGLRIQELAIDTHFRTLWLNDANMIMKNVLTIYAKQLENYKPEDIIILTPMRKTATGVGKLNSKLQDIANPAGPGKKEITVGGVEPFTLREGDRIIQNKNDYKINIEKDGYFDTGVFNGETGTVKEIDFIEDVITIEFDDGKIGYYELKHLSEISLAYALTYHKSQGSEYKMVICLLTTADYMLLQRKILYTGESRAKEKCFFVGHAKAFQLAMSNASGNNQGRNTSLNEFVEEDLAAAA